MSTTRTTSNTRRTSYTVVGGQRKDRIRKYSSVVTIMLLNRAGKFDREKVYEEFKHLDFAEILCVEGPDSAYDIEERTRRYPDIRFLLLKETVSVGERINVGFEETRSRHVVVTWSDIRLSRSVLTPVLIEKVEKSGDLCIVPLMRAGKSMIPSLHVPLFEGRKLKVMPWHSVTDGMQSIFPFDYCGIYDRVQFQLLGGFDQDITNPYWQKLDFGFRAFMWGQRLTCDTTFEVSYLSDAAIEDNTPDASYKIFYLKNVAVKKKEKGGILPGYRFLGYVLKSDTGPIYSFEEFMAVRKWVSANRDRFRQDCRGVIASWEIPE